MNAIERSSRVKSVAMSSTMDFLVSFRRHNRTATHPSPSVTEVRYGHMSCFGQVNVIDITSRQVHEEPVNGLSLC